MSERGQTTYDFAIGISVFLLVLIGVLSFLPGVFAAYENPVGADEQAEADRVAATLVENHRMSGRERTLSFTGSDGLGATVAGDLTAAREANGVPDYRRVNVTVLDGDRPVGVVTNGGETYDEQPAATAVRVVQFTDSDVCRPLCRIVVRVW